jgi:hypothetical protein
MVVRKRLDARVLMVGGIFYVIYVGLVVATLASLLG